MSVGREVSVGETVGVKVTPLVLVKVGMLMVVFLEMVVPVPMLMRELETAVVILIVVVGTTDEEVLRTLLDDVTSEVAIDVTEVPLVTLVDGGGVP